MLCSTSLPSPVCIPCSVHLPGHHVPLYLCMQHCIFHALLYIPAGTCTPSPRYDLYGWQGMDSKWPVCQYTSWFVIHLLVHSMICCTSASTLHGLLYNYQYTSWSVIHLPLPVHFMVCYTSISTLHGLLYIYQYTSWSAIHLSIHFMVCYTSISTLHDLLLICHCQYTSWSVVHLLLPICRSCLLLLNFSPARGSGVHHSPSFKPPSPHANLFRRILGKSVVSIHLFYCGPPNFD